MGEEAMQACRPVPCGLDCILAKADGSTASSSSFKYWTDRVDDTGIPPADPLTNMVTADPLSGTPKHTPAPWVPYTRAGCDVGAVALANVVLENTGTGPNGDMTKVFGSSSPEVLEAQASNVAPAGTKERQLAQTDFVGIAIHCGEGGICAGNPQARPDLLPDEPGGYDGFVGLFGAKYVNPAISGGSAVVHNLNDQPITDQFGQPGCPGFDGLFASTTLAYIAQMQEQGIPVTFGYISDAHDQHGVAGEIHATRGPGEADYVQQLRNCDAPCITVPTTPPTNTFAWSHGGIQPEIATTWLGMVGPGVRHLGDDDTWADHTDTRPTMLTLVGLQDTYDHDGRVLIDQLHRWAVPKTLRENGKMLGRLGEVYKQLNAPFGQFGMDTLAISTLALKSGSANDDSTYTALADKLSAVTHQRDALAGQMRSLLEEAAFGGQAIEEAQARKLIFQAETLLHQVHGDAQP